jgi:DNA-binding Lrp family transcriptional regulator
MSRKKLVEEGEEIKVSYILINTKPKHEHNVYNSLLDDPLVIELIPLFREYNMIAKVKIENTKKLGAFITDKIRSLDGVIDTKTLY